jgi:hypothetical protein
VRPGSQGEVATFTDTMHGILAIDPFLTAAVVLAAVAFPGRFRVYTLATLVFTAALALSAIGFVSEFMAGRPTPWMGAVERDTELFGQYVMNLWYAVLAVMLLRRKPAGPGW